MSGSSPAGTIPASSRSSRTAPAAGSSPSSTAPPGTNHPPSKLLPGARRSSRILPAALSAYTAVPTLKTASGLGSGSLGRSHDLAPALGVALVRRVEGDAADDVAVALRQLRCDLLGLADDGEGVQDVVVDERAHLLPLALLREPVELGLQVAPAVVVQHAAVRGRRSVERDLLACAGSGLLHLLFGGAGDDERRPGDLDLAQLASRLLGAALERGKRDRAEVGLGGEPVAEEAVGDLARDLRHQL